MDGAMAGSGGDMTAGIVAGSISAVVAALVSLPLRSPDDALLNSATVTLAALAAGVAAGLLWRGASPQAEGVCSYLQELWTAAFAVVALICVAGESTAEQLHQLCIAVGGHASFR